VTSFAEGGVFDLLGSVVGLKQFIRWAASHGATSLCSWPPSCEFQVGQLERASVGEFGFSCILILVGMTRTHTRPVAVFDFIFVGLLYFDSSNVVVLQVLGIYR